MQRFTATIEFDADNSGIALILFSLMNEAFSNQPTNETVPVYASLDRIVDGQRAINVEHDAFLNGQPANRKGH
jgi:hypothetical protein